MAVGAVLVFIHFVFLMDGVHRIVRAVTFDAGVLGIGGDVAILAFEGWLIFGVLKLEGVLDEICRRPGDGIMAASAVLAKLPIMDIRLVVAARALARGAGENLFEMAFGAFCLGMLTIERVSLVVDEFLHAVHAVMAVQAVGTNHLDV